MAIGGIVIALGALYALVVAYDISTRELGVYLLGSIALLVGTALASILVVLVFKLLKRMAGIVFGPLIRRIVSVDDDPKN